MKRLDYLNCLEEAENRELHEKAEHRPAVWKRLRSTEPLRRAPLTPIEKPRSSALDSKFPVFMRYCPCWGGLMVNQLSVNHFCSWKLSLTHTQVSVGIWVPVKPRTLMVSFLGLSLVPYVGWVDVSLCLPRHSVTQTYPFVVPFLHNRDDESNKPFHVVQIVQVFSEGER